MGQAQRPDEKPDQERKQFCRLGRLPKEMVKGWSRAERAWRMGQKSRASPSRGLMQWGGEVENDADSDDGLGEITLGAGWILDDTKHRALMLR